MELANIDKLLELYFEGKTTLEQEKELKHFFLHGDVPRHLIPYRSMFNAFDAESKEVSKRDIEFIVPMRSNKFRNFGIAASFLVLLGVSYMFFMNSGDLTPEEQEALVAYKEARKTMLLFSKGLNKGIDNIAHLSHFEKGTSSISVLNKFTESKELILK